MLCGEARQQCVSSALERQTIKWRNKWWAILSEGGSESSQEESKGEEPESESQEELVEEVLRHQFSKLGVQSQGKCHVTATPHENFAAKIINNSSKFGLLAKMGNTHTQYSRYPCCCRASAPQGASGVVSSRKVSMPSFFCIFWTSTPNPK